MPDSVSVFVGDERPFARLPDEPAGRAWPPVASLVELMAEKDAKLLGRLTGGGGVLELAAALGSSAHGIDDESDFAERRAFYGVNAFAEHVPKTYLELVWDGLHDTTIIALIAMAFIQ